MRKILLAFAALSLAGCSTAQISRAAGVPVPVDYANRTAADEQIGLGVELSYKGFRTALELGVDSGLIKGDYATAARTANRCAYQAVLVFRQAYRTANSADLLAASRAANIAIEDALNSFKGETTCRP